MRILVATDQWSPDVVGGSARVATDTARALARRGHELVVLAPVQPGLARIERDGELEVLRVLRRGLVPQTFADPVSTRRRARTLRERSFELLLAHQTTNAVGLAWARLDTPLALVFHASPVLELRFARERLTRTRRAVSYALDPLLVWLEREAIRSARGVLVLSSYSREILRGRHPGAAHLAHLVGGAADEAFFADPTAPEEFRARWGIPRGVLLSTVRRLEPRMGIDNLIEALSLVHDDRIVLAIAGTGTLHDALHRRINELGLEQRVRLLGRVPEEDLRCLYAASDLFVLPTVAYEGFGMSTVEALAAGTPTLGTDVGATPEIVGGLGPEFVVPTADPPALAAAIERILPHLSSALRARARRLAEKRYRWDTTIVAWEEALATIARR